MYHRSGAFGLYGLHTDTGSMLVLVYAAISDRPCVSLAQKSDGARGGARWRRSASSYRLSVDGAIPGSAPRHRGPPRDGTSEWTCRDRHVGDLADVGVSAASHALRRA